MRDAVCHGQKGAGSHHPLLWLLGDVQGRVQTSDEQSGNRLLRHRLSDGPIERRAGNTTKTDELLLTQCIILEKVVPMLS
jgi:hypothetical protein